MPRYIVKPEADLNLYVEWSTVKDGPLSWGTAEELELDPECQERIDRTGTSSFHGWDGWEDPSLLVRGSNGESAPWELPRENLKDFIEALDAIKDPTAHDSIIKQYATPLSR